MSNDERMTKSKCRMNCNGSISQFGFRELPVAGVKPRPACRGTRKVIRASEQTIHRNTSQARGPTFESLRRAEINVRGALENADVRLKIRRERPLRCPLHVRVADIFETSGCAPRHDVVGPVVERPTADRGVSA